MNALAVGQSFVADFKYLPTPRIRHGTQGRTNEAHVVPSPLTFNPLGQEPRAKVALRGSLHKKSTRVAAETTAVETLTNTGPKSHQIEWDAAEERTAEDEDGASMRSMVVKSRQHSVFVRAAGTSSYDQALMNAINILMGVGLLSIPFALKEVQRLALYAKE